jgi:hypothetical protein
VKAHITFYVKEEILNKVWYYKKLNQYLSKHN